MPTLFYALLLLVAAGIFAPLFHRKFSSMQTFYIGLTTAGCLSGLFDLALLLQNRETLAVSLSWLGIFNLSFAADSLSLFFLLPIFLILPLAALYSKNYLDDPGKSLKTGVSYFLLNLLAVSMVLLVMARDFLSFALSWELMSLSSLFLVLYDHEKDKCRKAAYIYLLFTQAGAFFIFSAFGLLFHATGSFAFDMAGKAPEGLKLIAFFLAMTGFASKAGVFPLHVWLPHAHPAAPAHVSAILSGVMIKMGIYGILRFYFTLGCEGLLFGQIILILGIVSGIFGVLHALGEKDLKGLLAYSSIENIGIIFIGLGIGMLGLAAEMPSMVVLAFAGSFLHVLNHSLFKPLLFMGAGAVLHGTDLRSIEQMGGLIKTMPVTGKSFVSGSVAISGLPPMNGFVGEFLIYLAAFIGLKQGSDIIFFCAAAILGLASIGGFAMACFTRASGIAFLGEARTEKAGDARECGKAMQKAMVALALSCLLIGLWPEPFIKLALFGIKDVLPGLAEIFPENLAFHLGNASRLFFFLILGAALVRRLFYKGKTLSRSSTWGCGFTKPSSRIQYTGTSYSRSILDFHRPLLEIRTKYSEIRGDVIFPGTTRYEIKALDRSESFFRKFMVFPICWVVDHLHWIQQGRIQLYIAYIVFTMILLLLLV